eukprot:3566481-Lingulodinium_polyedra.AAC.1
MHARARPAGLARLLPPARPTAGNSLEGSWAPAGAFLTPARWQVPCVHASIFLVGACDLHSAGS